MLDKSIYWNLQKKDVEVVSELNREYWLYVNAGIQTATHVKESIIFRNVANRPE